MDNLARSPPRTIVVVWSDRHGAEQRERRIVHFLKGFGSYVRWNKHNLLVDPLQDKLRVDQAGPATRRPL